MASNTNSTSARAQQPDLRSFIVYDRVPTGLAAWPVTDDSAAPHLRAGDFVIVDPADHDPAEGEIFLIQWKSAREPKLASMTEHEFNFTTGRRSAWMIGDVAPKQLADVFGRPFGPRTRWVDGPWDADYAREINLGRVVGILEASFNEPKLLAA